MKVKYKKVDSLAKTPSYALEGDGAMDLHCVGKVINDDKDYIEYDTGLAFEVPEDHVMLLFPRSSVSKMDLLMCNSVGVVDSNYRGTVRFRYKSTGSRVYEVGDRVGQFIVMPRPHLELEEVDDLSDSTRGEGGFGSTGK